MAPLVSLVLFSITLRSILRGTRRIAGSRVQYLLKSVRLNRVHALRYFHREPPGQNDYLSPVFSATGRVSAFLHYYYCLISPSARAAFVVYERAIRTFYL